MVSCGGIDSGCQYCFVARLKAETKGSFKLFQTSVFIQIKVLFCESFLQSLEHKGMIDTLQIRRFCTKRSQR